MDSKLAGTAMAVLLAVLRLDHRLRWMEEASALVQFAPRIPFFENENHEKKLATVTNMAAPATEEDTNNNNKSQSNHSSNSSSRHTKHNRKTVDKKERMESPSTRSPKTITTSRIPNNNQTKNAMTPPASPYQTQRSILQSPARSQNINRMLKMMTICFPIPYSFWKNCKRSVRISKSSF
jgi:hypothetical protein